ncbi:MAG: GNAT family N-acetyltransferase [Acidobacteriota bacterium]|nr:GNAT family N-acetyltransferase [Acidobacteriota bacterium]
MNSHLSPNHVTLRPTQPEDESFLAAVYGSTREQELAMVPWDAAQREAFILSQFIAQRTHYQTEYPQARESIILLDDQPAGRIYVDRRESEIRILDFTLLPAFRGQGIGTPIIRAVMDEAALGRKRVSINLDSFSQSHSLFERLGFKAAETTGFHTLFVWDPTTNNSG